MKENICNNCKTKFLTYTNKFCSRDCYVKNRIGKKRPESHKENNKNALLAYYKTDDWALKKEFRANKIRQARLKYCSDEDIIVLEKILKEKYVYNLRILAKKVNTNISYKTINNTFIKHPYLNDIYLKTMSFLPLKIQELSLIEWQEFKKDFNKQNITEFCQNYKINSKTHKRISNYFDELVPRLYWRKVETKPEKIFKQLLIENKILFEEQVRIGKYVADFLIYDNIVIEIQGDYWHANPKLYSENNLHSQQLKNIARDQLKHKLILSSNMVLIELWENDIYNKLEKINKLINIIKNGRFNRKFYSTNNWK